MSLWLLIFFLTCLLTVEKNWETLETVVGVNNSSGETPGFYTKSSIAVS